jgi:hypothetical protein
MAKNLTFINPELNRQERPQKNISDDLPLIDLQ